MEIKIAASYSFKRYTLCCKGFKWNHRKSYFKQMTASWHFPRFSSLQRLRIWLSSRLCHCGWTAMSIVTRLTNVRQTSASAYADLQRLVRLHDISTANRMREKTMPPCHRGRSSRSSRRIMNDNWSPMRPATITRSPRRREAVEHGTMTLCACVRAWHTMLQRLRDEWWSWSGAMACCRRVLCATLAAVGSCSLAVMLSQTYIYIHMYIFLRVQVQNRHLIENSDQDYRTI
jgi:hypothetical protein